MGDEGLNFVCYYLTSFTFLDTLKLNNCNLTDDGACLLARAIGKTSIDKLYIKKNSISIKGFETLLSSIKSRKNLPLIAAKNNQVEPEAASKLIKEFGEFNSVLFL